MTPAKKDGPHLSLEQKIVLIVSAITVCLVSLFGGLAFQLLRSRYEAMLYQSTAVSSSLVTQKLSDNLNDITILSDVIRSDKTIQRHLDIINSGGDYQKERSFEFLYATLQNYVQQNKQNYIAYAAIINPQFTTYTYGFEYDRLSDEMAQALTAAARAGKGSPVWVSNYTDSNYLFLVRQVRKIENLALNDLGTLAIAVNMDTLLDNIMKSSRNFQTIDWFFSENGRNIYSSPNLAVSGEALAAMGSRVYGPVRIDGHLYFFLRGALRSPQWEYYQFLPYDDVGNSQKITLVYYCGIFAVCLVLTIFFLHISIRRAIAGIRVLYEKMKAFRGDNASVVTAPNAYVNRNDEIGLLHRYFDSMATEIEALINKEYKLNLDMKDMQLKTLAAQINPHFLYNTLDSINWRAKAAHNEDISLMAESLGRLLRASLRVQDSLVSLDDDLQLVQSYLNIQKIRYEDRLIYSFQIDDSLRSVLIPPMCIQPLVENAIKYGLEEMLDDCHIIIQAVLSETQDMLIRVKNNGSAFEDHLLEKLQKSETSPDGLGLGLLNINQRIQLLYGTAYGLDLYNEDDFAVAMLRLPGPQASLLPKPERRNGFAETDHRG